ncbi:MAG: lipid A deacylase LpxR family protein [Gammaproteobacteria bacterium]|nr:lipid A deacylase LpxR family protein [Gammaproteobacteria bacterium]
MFRMFTHALAPDRRRFMLAAALLLTALSLTSPPLRAQNGEPALENGRPRGLPLDESGREKYNGGWTFAIDNDIFLPTENDYDYTGGFAFTFAGRRTAEWPWSLDPLVDRVEPLFFGRDAGAFNLHSQQIGLLAFTPDDLNNPAPIPDDRPYASLAFVAGSRTRVSHPLAPVDTTTVTLGLLGLGLAGALQRGIHKELDLTEVPEGWEHQISDGGELTARVAWMRQSLLSSNFQQHRYEYELKWARDLSLGYQTEAAVSLSVRWGRINTPWWSFTPDRVEYISQPAPVIGTSFRRDTREFYFWLGAKIRLRVYNAFLQGQFRDSIHEISSDDIEHAVGEAWIGATWQVTERHRLSYAIRYQTPELKHGQGDRNLIWGGIILSRDL